MRNTRNQSKQLPNVSRSDEETQSSNLDDCSKGLDIDADNNEND